jgi:hypothetical protein
MEGKNDLGMHHKTSPLVPLVGRDLSVPKDLEQIAAEKHQVTEEQIKVIQDLQVQLAKKAEKSLAPTKEELQQGHEEVQAIAKAAGEESRNKYPDFDRQYFMPNPTKKAPQEPWYKKGLFKKLWW